MDPALDIWVDDRQAHLDIRLADVLDRTTTPSLLWIVGELLADGRSPLVLDGRNVEVRDVAGETSLACCERLVQEAGGSLVADGVELSALTDGSAHESLARAPSLSRQRLELH